MSSRERRRRNATHGPVWPGLRGAVGGAVLAAGVIGMLAWSASGVLAQSAAKPADAIPANAKHHLERILGTWECTWNYLNPDGTVAGSRSGTETTRWLLDGRVIEMTTQLEGRSDPSKAWWFYDRVDSVMTLSSVDRDGNFWLLRGSPDDEVITSLPRRQPDGRMMTIRFTHEEIRPDSLTARMEYSWDGGVTWTPGFLETLKRVSK